MVLPVYIDWRFVSEAYWMYGKDKSIYFLIEWKLVKCLIPFYLYCYHSTLFRTGYLYSGQALKALGKAHFIGHISSSYTGGLQRPSGNTFSS